MIQDDKPTVLRGNDGEFLYDMDPRDVYDRLRTGFTMAVGQAFEAANALRGAAARLRAHADELEEAAKHLTDESPGNANSWHKAITRERDLIKGIPTDTIIAALADVLASEKERP